MWVSMMVGFSGGVESMVGFWWWVSVMDFNDGFHWWVDFRGGNSAIARLGFNGDHLGVGWMLQWRSGLGSILSLLLRSFGFQFRLGLGLNQLG